MKSRLSICNVISIATALLLLGGTGCATRRGVTKTRTGPPKAEIVRLAPGDELDIKFFYSPNLSDIQIVRPDGKITLQLVGDVQAAGRTPLELKHILASLYTELIEHPEVTVIVREQFHRAVYVTGAVNRPGRISMPAHLSAFDAVSRAGGFDVFTAKASHVIIIRKKDGIHRGWRVNLEKLLKGRPQEPFYLQPQDIVHVPQTTIANMNQWIEQHVNRMIPQLGIRYTKSEADYTITVDTTDNR